MVLINHKIWHLTACKISVSLSFLKWNEFLSYLWISVANINSEIRWKSFHFSSSSKTRDELTFYRLSDATFITKIRLYSFDPHKPHFYIVKLGFTGVYIIFLIFAQNIDCGYALEPPRRGGSNEYPQSMFWAKVWKIWEFFIWIFSIFGGEIFCIFE